MVSSSDAIDAAWQEMAENAVDSAHFHYLHGTSNMPQSQAEVKGLQLESLRSQLERWAATPGLTAPLVEVHISNIHRREPIYHRSLVSQAATAVSGTPLKAPTPPRAQTASEVPRVSRLPCSIAVHPATTAAFVNAG